MYTAPGRLLQATAATANEPGLGAGLIILIVLGVLSLTACVVAAGRGPVVRVTVTASVGLCYGSIALLLLLLPRDPTISDSTGLSKQTSYSMFLRVLFITMVRIAPGPAAKQ